jgi:Holliday junction resolvasome RuvABC ATP-dependent DNA helicase subunit
MTKYLTIGTIVLLLLFGIYFKYTEQRLEKKAQEIAELQIQVSIQNKTIEEIKEDSKKIVEIKNKLLEMEKDFSNSKAELNQKLMKLYNTAKNKPQLVENIINNATKERLRCIEIATGDIPVEIDDKNSVCKELIKNAKKNN